MSETHKWPQSYAFDIVPKEIIHNVRCVNAINFTSTPNTYKYVLALIF